MKNFPRLFRLMRPYLGRFIFASICLLFVSLAIAATTSLVAPIFNDVWSNTNFNAGDSGSAAPATVVKKEDAYSIARKYLNIDALIPQDLRVPYILIPILLIVIFFLKGVFSYTGHYLMASVGQGVVRDIRNSLYSSIIAKPISFFRRRSTGSLISRIASDVDRIQYAVSTNLSDLILETLTVFGLGAMVLYYNFTFGVISFIIAPLVVAPIVRFGRRLRATSRKSQEQMERLTNRLQETFTGIRIVKAFCAEEHEKERFRQENDGLLRVFLKGTKYYSLTAPVMEVIGSFGIAFMIYWGYLQIADGAMMVGDFAVIMGSLYGMYNPLKRLSRVNNDLQQAYAAIDRVEEILTIRDEVEENPQAVDMPPFEREITFERVSFSYEERTILHEIDFSVRKGTVCAIVGLSGAGKTTLVNLLPRFDEVSSGRLTIDGRGIGEFTLASLRGQIGIVTQETILFNDSVRANIVYGNGSLPDENMLIEAAKAAYAHDFIMRMPQGYNTIIGEKGVKLSGGERQRLAIARALIKNPPILILDEATSALDSESERLVQRALENLMAHRTTFVIAHRLSTVRRADMILVLHDGHLVEQGTHEELLARDGQYSKLHRLQFADISESQISQQG